MIDKLAKQLFNDIQQKFDDLNQQTGVGDNIKGAFPASQLKAAIESALRKCNVVTREEFDAQQAVLLRTREKLEALEKKLEEL